MVVVVVARTRIDNLVHRHRSDCLQNRLATARIHTHTQEDHVSRDPGLVSRAVFAS